MTNEEKETQLATALRMHEAYKGNKRYSAYQRAVDHAIAYEIEEPGREYWSGVAELLHEMRMREEK